MKRRKNAFSTYMALVYELSYIFALRVSEISYLKKEFVKFISKEEGDSVLLAIWDAKTSTIRKRDQLLEAPLLGGKKCPYALVKKLMESRTGNKYFLCHEDGKRFSTSFLQKQLKKDLGEFQKHLEKTGNNYMAQKKFSWHMFRSSLITSLIIRPAIKITELKALTRHSPKSSVLEDSYAAKAMQLRQLKVFELFLGPEKEHETKPKVTKSNTGSLKKKRKRPKTRSLSDDEFLPAQREPPLGKKQKRFTYSRKKKTARPSRKSKEQAKRYLSDKDFLNRV